MQILLTLGLVTVLGTLGVHALAVGTRPRRLLVLDHVLPWLGTSRREEAIAVGEDLALLRKRVTLLVVLIFGTALRVGLDDEVIFDGSEVE